MMFNYYKAKKEIGDRHNAAALYSLAKTKTFYAYKEGVAHGPFDDVSKALKISKNVETVYKEDEEVAAKLKVYHAELLELDARWQNELREEYQHLSDKLFSHIYGKAYQDGHANGHDEIYSEFVDLAEFVEKAIDICTKK